MKLSILELTTKIHTWLILRWKQKLNFAIFLDELRECFFAVFLPERKKIKRETDRERTNDWQWYRRAKSRTWRSRKLARLKFNWIWHRRVNIYTCILNSLATHCRIRCAQGQVARNRISWRVNFGRIWKRRATRNR